LARNWSITSDSLSVWLARHLGAEHLVLVKSVQVECGEARPEELVRRGLVDQEFPRMLPFMQGRTRLLGAHHIARFSDLILGNAVMGLEVL
ncbi:MAG: hypothetical protein ACKVQA_21520, partial [Burkholderiales bacterium]